MLAVDQDSLQRGSATQRWELRAYTPSEPAPAPSPTYSCNVEHYGVYRLRNIGADTIVDTVRSRHLRLREQRRLSCVIIRHVVRSM